MSFGKNVGEDEREFNRVLGAAISIRRQQAGLSAGRLAMLTGISRPHISNIENGLSRVTTYTLAQLQRFIGPVPLPQWSPRKVAEPEKPGVQGDTTAIVCCEAEATGTEGEHDWWCTRGGRFA